MTIKPIKQKTFDELLQLSDRKLDSKIEWLNHTGYIEAFEQGGRLCYRVKVIVSRNMSEIKEFSTISPLDGEYRKVLELL